MPQVSVFTTSGGIGHKTHFCRQVSAFYLQWVDSPAADYAALLGAQSLVELVGTADAMRPGLRVWMLIPGGGKHYFLSSEGCDVLDSLAGDQVGAIAVPLIFAPITPEERWAKGLLDLLQYSEDWLVDTRWLQPVWAEGRLLAIVGGASATASSAIEELVRFAVAAMRNLDQVESARRDACAVKELLLHPDKSTVVATYRGKVIAGTQGGLAILNRLLGRDRLLACRDEAVLPEVLRAAIVKRESNMVIEDLTVHISRIIHPVPTTIESAFTLTFSRHLKATETRSAAQGFDSLSPAEKRILPCILEGKQNKEIASALNLSLSTVKRHLEHILEKCQCPNRLVLMARMGQASPASKLQPIPGLAAVKILPAPVRKMSDAA
jgi:DNA-binding CsgD family transcriptional regulator